jgi:acetyl esterase
MAKQGHLLFDRDPVKHRELVGAAKPPLPPADVNCTEKTIDIKDAQLLVRIYSPKNSTEKHLPTFFYIPGSAFIAFGDEFAKMICSHLCKQSGQQIIELRHRLAPEYAFPKGIEDSYRLFCHFLDHADENRIQKDRVSVGGYSSGGNFAIALANQAALDGRSIDRLVLASPLVDVSNAGLKAIGEKDTDIPATFIKWCTSLYIPKGVSRRNPRISPLFWREKETSTWPRTHVIFGERDLLRHQIEKFIEKLRAEGTEVKEWRVAGETHAMLWRRPAVIKVLAEALNSKKNGGTRRVKLPRQSDISSQILQH